MYASVNWVSISWGKGLSPVGRQAITWTNAYSLSIGPLRTNFSEILNRNSNISIQENSFENVVCEKAAIFPRVRCDKADQSAQLDNNQKMDARQFEAADLKRYAIIILETWLFSLVIRV